MEAAETEEKVSEDDEDNAAEEDKDVLEIGLAVRELSKLNQEQHHLPTTSFLALSNLVIRLLDKIGPTMAVLRHDLRQNVERVEGLYSSDPTMYASLKELLKRESDEGVARKANSCSKAVLWLTRAMDFSLALLGKLESDSESSLDQLVEEAYKKKLKPWHGWISSAASKVIPSSFHKLSKAPSSVMGILLSGQGQDQDTLRRDIKSLASLIEPFLDEVHAVLRKFRLDRLKST